MMLIRPAELNDAEALYRLARDFATSFAVDEAALKAALPRLLSAEDAYLVVAERNGDVVGYVLGFSHDTFYANGPVGWVEEITVRADLRRQGVGAALMTAFEAWARARGCRLVALATRRAAAFYTALGYEESAVYFRRVL